MPKFQSRQRDGTVTERIACRDSQEVYLLGDSIPGIGPMNDTQGIGDTPPCSACGSGDVERIEGGAAGIYQCLDCGTEFDADDDSDHAETE